MMFFKHLKNGFKLEPGQYYLFQFSPKGKKLYTLKYNINTAYSIKGGEKMGDIKEIKSVQVLPFALMIGVITAVIGFLYVLVFVLPMMLLMPAPGMEEMLGFGAVFGGLMLIITPVLSFILGFILYVIIALVYNVLAPIIGGVKVELE